MQTDEDERQEYQCLLLEGHTPEEAAEQVAAERSRFWREQPYWGLRDYEWHDKRHVCFDYRSDDEREADWAFAEAYGPKFDELCGMLSDRRQDVLRLRFGLGGGEPLGFPEVAAQLGMTAQQTYDMVYETRRRLRELWADKYPDDAPPELVDARRAYLARKRAAAAARRAAMTPEQRAEQNRRNNERRRRKRLTGG